MSKLLEYMQNANHPADVYIEKASDDSSADDSSSSEGSGFLSGLRNFLEHPFQGSGTVIAPNYTPRPLDDSVYSDIPGTPVASGQFGELEDKSVRDERMKDSADYMAANWPRLYGGFVAADEGLANVVGGIQNAVGGGNGILTNVQRAEEGMQDYRDQWNNTYGDSYFLNPNKFATDAGSVIGSSVPIMAFSGLMPGAAVAGGTRALTSALSRAGLGRLAMSKAGQALIADTVRSIPTSNLADSLSEYGTVVNDMMQNGVSEDEARRRAIPMFFKNMALDTFTVPLELGVMKGGKGIATGLLGRGAEEGIGKSLAKGAARTGMLAGASGLTEGYQEGAQNALENDVQGNRDGGWYNPFTWTKEDWEAARGGFVGGALMGVPGNVAAGFHPEARQAPLSAESREQAQSIKDTLSHGKPKGMSNAAYNAYIELANSGNPDLIKQAASSLESFQKSQGNSSSESTDDAATEAYKDYEAYDQKQEIENFLNNNTVEQIGGEDNYNWLVGVLRNGTPEEVQKAYNDVIAAEKATAEQEAKNHPARSGGSVSPNTGNAMVNAVIQAANDSGVDPRLALAIAARESGGDDVNAISMPEPHDGIYGIMQAQEETVSELGLDSQYPDWKTDPYQNAMVGMAILKSKIANENGDVWAGVRDYNGAGEEAEQYRQLVKNNYDNMGDIGGGGGGNATYDGLQLTLPDSDEFTDQSGNVSGLTEDTRMKLRVLDNLCYQKFGQHLIVSSSYREGDPNNHGAGVAFDVSGGIVDDPDARQWLEQAGPAVGLFVIPEYQGEAGSEFAHGDNVHFSNVEPGIYGQTRNAEGHWSEEHAAPSIQSILKGGASSGVSSKAAGDNGQFERELDQAAQEAKSDMDKIQAQSDQAMNEIMNDDSAEKTAQDAQQDAESAQKQAEESQQSAQDDVVPDVAQTIRDTSNNIDEINALDGMFTKDGNGNDKFIDTPENRDFIKANYKDEITKAVNDAMSKKKAPIATPVPKNKQQTPHARLGRILATYDRKDPKFKEYMNTFRNGTEQEQRKLADDLQTTQELERANSLKGNPLTSQQDQNALQNASQQPVEASEQSEQVNTPTQVKESLETQKKRNAYLSKKQKLMERVPSGKTVKVHASTSDAGFDATYKIVPAGDITASHNTDYAVNDLYPAEYQPRDRNRPQMRGQVEKMAKTMKPELLAESQFVNEGAPVVNNSGVVLNGNGRVMAIQKAYKGLTDAHKKSAEAYKDYLVSIAPSLGIAPEKVQSMDHPVLVRQAADDADTNAIINSTEGGAKLGGAEQAKADADRLKLSTLEQFVDNGTGEFMNPSNREFRRAAASDVFSDAEGNSVFNEKGDLSPTGQFRIRNAIFAKAYDGNYLLTQLSEATDNNSKNIMNAMIAAAPEVAKVNEGIKEGNLYPDYDISDVITKTAKTIMSLRNEGKPLSFHLQETNLFSQGESEAERLVLEFIERNKFKSRTIADMYKAVCDRIFAVGSPKQSKLFDSTEAPRISLENIISNAIQEVEHGQSLFDTAEEKPAEKAVSEVPDNRQAEPAGSGRVHQQEAGRVQSQEKEGNEVDEKSKQSDHVDTEPQQTESKDTEGTHAEEGSQGDVQEEISKSHDLLNSKESTPRKEETKERTVSDDTRERLHELMADDNTKPAKVAAAYIRFTKALIEDVKAGKVDAKTADKQVTDEYKAIENSRFYEYLDKAPISGAGFKRANANAHKFLRGETKEKTSGVTPYKQAVDDIMDRLDHKKLTPTQAINKLKTIMKDANDARWGEFKAMEAIESKEKLSFDDYKMALDLANDAMKKVNDMRLEASRNRKARKTTKELESATKETQNDADIRFGTVEDAEKAVMEAFGIKPHKKPADTPTVPHKASTKATPKKAVKKAIIKDNDKIEKTFHLLDDSDEALEAEKKAILEELSHLSANPAFNPTLMYHLLKVGAIHVQRGLNEFARWAKAMKDTLPQSEPFLHSVWDSLQSMPNNATLDEKQLTAAIRYVGSLYDHGMTDKVDLRKSFIATLGVKNAKYFDAVYNAVMEYPSIEELKGANDNVSSNVPELVARSGEGASENAVGESRIQGRTAVRGSRQDTAPAGKEPQKQGMGHDSLSSGSTATGRTTGNRRVQTQESKDSTGSTGSTELPGSVRAGLERVPDDDQRRPDELVRAAQNRPQHEDPVNKVQEEQKDKHLDEIKKALPMLLPQQAEDVCIAENRFKDHSGMMFTNGTGTGKTYTGLGVVKRFADAGKKNILIIAPSDGILKQWEEAATKDFGITLTRLDSTKDAGKGAVTATYANVGANQALVNRDFDLVITDESHNLMGSESAKPTDALQLVRAVTGHEDGFQRYHHDKHPEISSKLDELHEEIKKLRKRDSQNGKAYNETHDPSLADESREIRNQIEKLEEERSKWHKKLETFKDADEKAFAEKQPSKVLFLSATPFQYVADLDYANGYLFNYSDYGPMDEQGYNRANGRETFYMENFGYKMRYNRLERPGSDVDTDLMEREFNRKMVESGAMHGRMLSSAYDYDRGFIRVDAGIGKKIDEGFDWLRDQPKYSELSDFLRGRFTGQQKYYLLEAIKAKQAIPLIKEYLKEGKKVVIFHNFNKGGADNPFAISREGMDHLERLDSELADHILEQYHEFQAERPDLADLDLNDLESPIETLSKAFGDELVLYNGTLSKGEREKNKNSFNNDDSKTKIILVQSAAGQAGVSLHDTTGKHQRALINLGLPTRPSEAIQQEGRIYRVGNKSNAIFRYLNTGTYMEQMAFATKLAERAGTVENIALGEMARSLKQAYVEAFEESQEGDGWKKYLPGSKTEGTGGKANDYRQEKATDFDRAKAVYFGKQKKNSRTKSQEGHDYFATPEPVGYKMVQWLQSKPGQSLLEPSAGDGAIARWMPDNTYNTVVEPSRDLTPKLMRNVAGAKVVESTFENFDLHNKFDGIAMNPPFGKGKDRGGKLAMEHVAKAYKHLKDGGRLIAIIPDGPACQARFDKWFYGNPEAKRKEDRGVADGVLMADIHLPSVTFNREGTSVNTRMVVIDKYADEGTRQVAEAEARGRIDIAADDVNELFDRIEGMDMPERLDMSDEKKQASIRKAGQQLSRSKEELKAEIKEAFPNAKEIKDEGDRMTFTMPNGSHIVVDLKNEILLTDEELAQAKKDHHIDDNGNVVVEGYAQLHGKDAYMALSQGSRENTGFHEAYHLAEGAVLTDREKNAIKKAIPDAEKRADKYAEWVEARKNGRGTAWGKLFQKIKDFAAKMKKIFTGAETVNDVFRQIESGRVWERNVREQGTKQSNQPLYQAKHIVSTFADKINLNRFVNAVLTHNEKSLIMHLGKVDADEAVAIKEATGYDVSNYEHVWRSNDVRHAQKRHGIDTETASDQIGLSPEEMVDALKVISAPDKIERGSINKEGPSIRYIKADNNGQLTIVEVVRSKRKTLDIKTMWKKRAEKLHGDYALQDTSETALDATSSTTENVAHNTDNVNGEKHYSIRKPKDAADEAQEKAEQVAEDTAVTMKDILAAARKILPIYTRSKIHYNSRATYRYDEHGRAGFVPSNYTLGDIGASIALHLDHVAQLKGANVELTNDVLDELEIEQRAAKKYKQEAPKAMTPVEARREGVKEFGRIYFQDPARAKEKYPKYYDIFEKTLDGMPEEKAAVEKILELEAQRAAQNPLLLATAGLSLADDRKKPKTVKERLNTAWARFYRTMVDETDPLRQITKCIEMELGKKLADEKDPHKRAVMCNSVAEGRASMLLFADNKAANLAYLNKIYKGAIRDKVTFEDVLNTLRKVRTEDIKKAAAKDVETYFGMYLVAQRTEEIVKTHKNYVRPEGYSHENCLRIIAEAPEAIRKAAQLYWKYNRNLVNIMEAEGLISEKQAAGLRKYEKYCPMYRDMSEHRTFDDELPTITAGRGFINQSSGIKKLKGGSILAVINPIDSMVSMTTALIARCERNDVAKVMVQSAEDHPGLGRIIVKDPSLFRADASKCAFTVMIAGKKTVYRTTPELYQALQEMSTNSAAFLTNVFGKFTDALRFGATNTPSFMVRNFIRDTLSASVNARYGKFVPIVDSIRGMKALKGDADFRAKFYGQGVPMDTYIRRDIRGAKQYKDKVQKSLKRYPLGIRQLMALSRSLVHKYNDVGEALEQGTRAGAMLNALKAGASDFEAGQEARDVTVNFSRHGSFGKKVNRYVPFFNASIQGTDKVIRTFLENPKRASLATCLYIILPTIILWAINHDDDWYKELDDNTKYTNWAVHIPGTDYHWLIPKPQEVGIGFGSGVEAVLNQMLNEDPHAMKAWARQFAEVVTPGIIMTALRPVLEWRYNYSEWTGRKLVPERLSKLPPEQQYTTATSELAKLMSQFAGKYVGLSPIAIDNFFSGWFGSLGRMSANALNKPIDAIRGSSRPPEPARYWYESPFIGSFARQDGQNSVYVERFYQLAEDMEMDYKRSDSYAKNKGKKGAPIPASLKAAQTCMKTMTKINKDIRSIKDDPKMDPETKRKRIDAAYTKMRTYAKKFVTQFDK